MITKQENPMLIDAVITKAGRVASIQLLQTWEEWVAVRGERSCQVFENGYKHQGQALGLLRRQLKTDEAYGWPDNQVFYIYKDENVGTWHVFAL